MSSSSSTRPTRLNMDERLVEAAQALLTGYDTALSRQWREEDRAWRQADLSWREREATFMYARLC